MIVDCYDGIEDQLDCGVLGMTCFETEDEAFCGFAGSSCADDRCEGTTVVNCQDGIEGASIDCKALDPAFTCRDAFGAVSCAVPSGSEECDLLLDTVLCEGDVARACIGGKHFDFDCGAFLGAHCETDGLGTARCVSADWP